MADSINERTLMETYLLTWLATATAGKVTIAFWYDTNRMRLDCDLCKGFGKFDIPLYDTMTDWPLQQFVKFHSINGPHMATQGTEWVDHLKPPTTAVTPDTPDPDADFSYVRGKKIYWERDSIGRIIGVTLTPPSKGLTPPPKAGVKNGRRFR